MKRTTAVLAGLTMAASLSLGDVALAQDNGELADAQRQLQEAQQQLERAARDVARLSAEANAPFVGGVMRDFHLTGRRAMLGINIEDADEGVLVAGVSPGGPADEAGVETGDIVIAIDGAELSESETSSPSEVLIAQMAHVAPGDTVRLTLLRDDDEYGIDVQTRAFEPRFYTSPATPLRPGEMRGMAPPFAFNFTRPIGVWADMELVELTPELGAYFGTDEGILVVRASSAEELELLDGDVILEIGGRTPMSTQHAMRILGSFEPGETLELTIMRDQRRETLEVELPARGRSG